MFYLNLKTEALHKTTTFINAGVKGSVFVTAEAAVRSPLKSSIRAIKK